jgi:methylenetetrahydrofolate reductase (NADPH)
MITQQLNTETNMKIPAALLDQAYLEIIPTPSILDRLVHIPRHCFVGISCSPKHGIEPTLALVESLRELPEEQQLKLIPHISARVIRDKGHLRQVLARLDAARVESVFVPAGDRSEPIGRYADSLELLRDIAEIGHNIEDIGVTGHPEGHPFIDDRQLMWFLKEKQQFSTYLVTQMCFDPQAIVNWLKQVRVAGITLPAWIGLPGVTDISKLVSLSLRIGVGQSLDMLKKQKGLLKNLMTFKPYRPDDLLTGLAPYISDPGLNIPGFHLFSFNDVERTENWRKETFEKLNQLQVQI